LAALDVCATLMVGGTLEDRPVVNDREVKASSALASLA
jgi:hypothetical protein